MSQEKKIVQYLHAGGMKLIMHQESKNLNIVTILA